MFVTKQNVHTGLPCKAFLLILLALFLITCSKPDEDGIIEPTHNPCAVTDPLNDFAWLKNIISNTGPSTMLYSGARIYSYVINDTTVFYIWNPGLSFPSANVYSCSGTNVISSSAPQATWDKFNAAKTQEKLLWVKPVCEVTDPLTELTWLKNIINNNVSPEKLYGGARIYSYLFKGSTVIYISNPAVSITTRTLYNCKGEVILHPGSSWEDWDEFRNKKAGEVLLWTKPICGVENPLTGLPWLKKIISDSSAQGRLHFRAFVCSYMFKGEQVFFVSNRFSATKPYLVYNCSGEVILDITKIPISEWSLFEKDRTHPVVLWHKGACGELGAVKDLAWLKNIVNNGIPFTLNPGARIYMYFVQEYFFINIVNPGAPVPEAVYSCDGTISFNNSAPKARWELFWNQRELETLLFSKD